LSTTVFPAVSDGMTLDDSRAGVVAALADWA
jgi:hypothetical protein